MSEWPLSHNSSWYGPSFLRVGSSAPRFQQAISAQAWLLLTYVYSSGWEASKRVSGHIAWIGPDHIAERVPQRIGCFGPEPVMEMAAEALSIGEAARHCSDGS